MKNFNLRAGTAVLALLFATQAAAQSAPDLGGIATGLTSQVQAINTLVTILAFVIGVAMAIAGFLKFRAHSQNPNDPSNKLSTAFMLIFVGAGLVALNLTLGSGIQTIFGGGSSIDVTTGFTRVGN